MPVSPERQAAEAAFCETGGGATSDDDEVEEEPEDDFAFARLSRLAMWRSVQSGQYQFPRGSCLSGGSRQPMCHAAEQFAPSHSSMCMPPSVRPQAVQASSSTSESSHGCLDLDLLTSLSAGATLSTGHLLPCVALGSATGFARDFFFVMHGLPPWFSSIMARPSLQDSSSAFQSFSVGGMTFSSASFEMAVSFSDGLTAVG